MTLKLVQAGQGAPRNVAFFFLVDATIMGAKLKAALGPNVCIITDADAHGTETYQQLLSKARTLGGFAEIAGVAMVGYSMGGQRVRGLLAAGADPCAVVIIDGTHDTIPASHLEVWRSIGKRAVSGKSLFVATCTQQTYTDDLPPSQRFLCTRHTLEQAFSLALPPNTEAHDHDMHILSYPSARIDGPAHILQAQVTMPDMCQRYIAPWLAGWLKPPKTSQTPAPEPAEPVHNEPLAPLAERCALWCENEALRGIKEEPIGSNTSERIREYLAPCERNGKLLGLRAAAWCAAAACCCMRECLAPGEPAPHPYRCSMAELEADSRRLGNFKPAGGAYRPKRGDMLLMKRAGSDPAKATWEGHVCRVVAVTSDSIVTLGGNENNTWGRTTRRLDDPHLIGFVEYP